MLITICFNDLHNSSTDDGKQYGFGQFWFSSAGYGLILTAETTEGIIYHGEEISFPKGSDQLPKQPEDVGTGAAHKLLQQIFLVSFR